MDRNLDAGLIDVVATGEGKAPAFEILTAAARGTRDLLGEMLRGALGGVILRETISPEVAQATVKRLRDAPGESGPVVCKGFPGHTYGAVLVVSPPDLEDYLRRGRDLLRCLDEAGIDLVPRFEAALASLSGEVPLRRFPARPIPLTVRVLAAGQGVAVHSERGNWDSMKGMQPEVKIERQLSCYVPLRLADAGGELEIFHRPPSGREPAIDGLADEEACSKLAVFGATLVRPAVGDLLVFDGGRFNHRVRPGTSGERWTAGAFLADGTTARHLWS